jgi:hypothetical protein
MSKDIIILALFLYSCFTTYMMYQYDALYTFLEQVNMDLLYKCVLLLNT